MQLRNGLRIAALSMLCAGICASAAAQTDSDTVPAAPPLSEPGESASGADQIIHLHMPAPEPVHLRRTQHKPAAAPAATNAATLPERGVPAAETSANPPTASPAIGLAKTQRPPRPQKRSTATAESAPAPPAAAIPLSFGDEPQPEPAALPQATPPPTIKGPERTVARPAPLPPRRTASLSPTRVEGADRASLSKRGAILFAKGVSNPVPAQFNGVKLLAGDLNSALQAGASRVQLEAYGGNPGDKSSDARRLSLQRALAVRQLLIDDGVPSNRIDVRAMGGADDKGPADRVDVFVRAG